MSLRLTITQTPIEAGITTTRKPYTNPPFKFFGSTFLERKVEKNLHKLTTLHGEKMKKMNEFIKKHEEVVKYLIFGVLTTFVGWFTYFAVLLSGKAILGLPPEDTTSGSYLIVYTAAQVIQWITAVLFAFFTNKKWVFTDADNKQSTMRQLAIFSSGRVVTFFVDYGVTFFGAIALSAALPALNSVLIFGKELNINEISSKLVAAIIVVISNYFFSKIFVFKKNKDSSDK